jgi:hypothetical protein
MFESLFSQILVQPRVVHRLPGRLRVHIPALLRIENNQKVIESLLERIFSIPEDINQVQVQCVTGNILFHFQKDTLTESEILAWIRNIGSILLREKNHLMNTPIESMPQITDKIVDIFRHSIRYRLDLKKEVVIPNDIWSH